MSESERLREGLAELGLDDAGDRIEKLETFISEIRLWNPRYKLVGRDDDLITRHVLDSLVALRHFTERRPAGVADIGSGAGFPGIPLALWMEETGFRLIERSGRRAGFLRNVAVSLGLKNVEVVEKPVEECAGIGPFDIVTFRAWSALNSGFLAKVRPLVAAGGAIIAYKGKMETARSELSDLRPEPAEAVIETLEVPGTDEERCLVIIRL